MSPKTQDPRGHVGPRGREHVRVECLCALVWVGRLCLGRYQVLTAGGDCHCEKLVSVLQLLWELEKMREEVASNRRNPLPPGFVCVRIQRQRLSHNLGRDLSLVGLSSIFKC